LAGRRYNPKWNGSHYQTRTALFKSLKRFSMKCRPYQTWIQECYHVQSSDLDFSSR
jgi:hypothetical protein